MSYTPDGGPLPLPNLDWPGPDRCKKRLRAQKRSLKHLKYLLKNTDMRLGQIIAGIGMAKGTPRDSFYITDEMLEKHLARSVAAAKK